MITSGEFGDHEAEFKQKAVQEMLGRMNLQPDKVILMCLFHP